VIVFSFNITTSQRRYCILMRFDGFLINYFVFIVFYVRTGHTKVIVNLKNLLITMYVTSLKSLDGIVLISNDWKK